MFGRPVLLRYCFQMSKAPLGGRPSGARVQHAAPSQPSLWTSLSLPAHLGSSGCLPRRGTLGMPRGTETHGPALQAVCRGTASRPQPRASGRDSFLGSSAVHCGLLLAATALGVHSDWAAEAVLAHPVGGQVQ